MRLRKLLNCNISKPLRNAISREKANRVAHAMTAGQRKSATERQLKPQHATGCQNVKNFKHSAACQSNETRRNGHSPEIHIAVHSSYGVMLTLILTLTIDLLNPKSIGFDIVSRTTIVPRFKSLWSGVFIYIPPTHTSWQSDRNIRASSSEKHLNCTRTKTWWLCPVAVLCWPAVIGRPLTVLRHG